MTTIDSLKKRWNNKIKEIETQELNKVVCSSIYGNFSAEAMKFSKAHRDEVYQLAHDLEYALDKALLNYKKKNPSFFMRLSKNIKNLIVNFNIGKK
jgi:hypothetical protein